MELENMAANTADVSAPEDTGSTDTAAVGSDAASSGSSDTGQDVSRTQAFSRRLNEMSAQRTDAAIAALGMTNPYTGSPISTLAQMQEYRAMQEADENGTDPSSAAELSRLRTELHEYKQREQMAGLTAQENAIRSDPSLGPLYEEYREEVFAVLEDAAERGETLDLDAALRWAISLHYDDIRTRDIERAKAEALAGVKANAAASPGSLSGAPTGDTMDWASMSSEEFARHLEIAKRGGYRKT